MYKVSLGQIDVSVILLEAERFSAWETLVT